jgi:hypothetical protein
MTYQPWYTEMQHKQAAEDFKKSLLGKELKKKKQEEEEKKRRKQMMRKKISQRLKKPLFKPGRRTGTRGSGLGVSASAGIRGLWGRI